MKRLCPICDGVCRCAECLNSCNILKKIPNAISFMRIVGAAVLLCLSEESLWFAAVYLMCGISDMLDGFLARKLNAESMTGATLDSIADMVFVAVAAVKIFLKLSLPAWIWRWVSIIVLARIAVLQIEFVQFGRFGYLHNTANRAMGIMLFASPLAIMSGHTVTACALLCAAATAAVIIEICVQITPIKEFFISISGRGLFGTQISGLKSLMQKEQDS